MEAQDQLERKYISKKEEHRALEMQNYMGLTRNTGTFDPNRLKTPHHIALMGMCHHLSFMYANAMCVQAGRGRYIQGRNAPGGHKGGDRQKHVRADVPTPLILHSHTHCRTSVAQPSLSHRLTSIITA